MDKTQWLDLRNRVGSILLRRLIPFKGTYAYEIQVGPQVIQWFHKQGRKAVGTHYVSGIGPLRFWVDSHWLSWSRVRIEFGRVLWAFILLVMAIIMVALSVMY